MTTRNPSRGRRAERRAAERRALKEARRLAIKVQRAKQLQVPESVRALAAEAKGDGDA